MYISITFLIYIYLSQFGFLKSKPYDKDSSTSSILECHCWEKNCQRNQRQDREDSQLRVYSYARYYCGLMELNLVREIGDPVKNLHLRIIPPEGPGDGYLSISSHQQLVKAAPGQTAV